MNGQTNENQPVRPDFSGSSSAGGPMPLNGEGIGFNNQPVSSGWSPNTTAPTPGPIEASTSPMPISSAPPVLMPSISGVSASPVPSPVAPINPVPPINEFAVPPLTTPSRSVAPSLTVSGNSVAASVPPSSGAPQYEIKTLASDTEALKASGGMEALPKTFTPVPASGEELFVPTVASVAEAKKASSNKINKIILIIGAIVIIIGLAVAGFIFVRPLFMTPTQAPEPIAPEPIPTETPPVAQDPLGGTLAPVHVSFFATPADATDRLNVEIATIDSLKALFPAPEDSALTDGSIRELIVFAAGVDVPLGFSSFLPTMLPDMLPSGITAAFEENFTLFVYKDGAHYLPGFIARVKTGVSPETLAAVSTALEASPNIGNFYAVSPGAKTVFRDGAVNNNPTRFVTFAIAGHAFNYGWFKDDAGASYLVGSSSYKGIIAAVNRAGF